MVMHDVAWSCKWAVDNLWKLGISLSTGCGQKRGKLSTDLLNLWINLWITSLVCDIFKSRKAAHQSCGKPVDSVDNFVHMSTGVRRASFPQAVDGAVEKFLPSAGARAGRGHAIPAHRVPCQRPHPRNAKRVQRVLKGCVSLSACTPCLRVFHRVIHMVWMSRSGREASPTGKGRGLASPTPSAHQPCAAM